MRRNLFWLSEERWARIRAALADRCSRRRAVDDCRVISGIVRVQWLPLVCPPECGPPTTIYNRFVRWARRGPWEDLFRELARRGRSADTQMID